jgi:hypothetical protein
MAKGCSPDVTAEVHALQAWRLPDGHFLWGGSFGGLKNGPHWNETSHQLDSAS